jgi:hypothetical protein
VTLQTEKERRSKAVTVTWTRRGTEGGRGLTGWLGRGMGKARKTGTRNLERVVENRKVSKKISSFFFTLPLIVKMKILERCSMNDLVEERAR